MPTGARNSTRFERENAARCSWNASSFETSSLRNSPTGSAYHAIQLRFRKGEGKDEKIERWGERKKKNDLKWQTKETLLLIFEWRCNCSSRLIYKIWDFFFSTNWWFERKSKSCTRRWIFGFRVMIKILFERMKFYARFMFEWFCAKQIIIFYSR